MNSPSRNKAYISQLAACVMAAVSCFAASTFAVVWQHQSNVRIAKENDRLEKNIISLGHYQTAINKQVADEQTFEKLSRHNARFGLNLAPIREQQLVRVTIDPNYRLEQKANTVERIGYLSAAPAENAPAADTRPAIIRFVNLTR